MSDRDLIVALLIVGVASVMGYVIFVSELTEVQDGLSVTVSIAVGMWTAYRLRS